MCMIDDDWSRAEFYRQSTHTARQPHRCGECYRVIQPGERYRVATGRQNGEFWTAKQCAHCMRAARRANQHPRRQSPPAWNSSRCPQPLTTSSRQV